MRMAITSKAHTDILKKHNIEISMDGVGRATDNICIERFWRSEICNLTNLIELELNDNPNLVLNAKQKKWLKTLKKNGCGVWMDDDLLDKVL